MLEKKKTVKKTVNWLAERKKSEQDKGIRISWFDPLKREESVLWLKEGQPATCLLQIAS